MPPEEELSQNGKRGSGAVSTHHTHLHLQPQVSAGEGPPLGSEKAASLCPSASCPSAWTAAPVKGHSSQYCPAANRQPVTRVGVSEEPWCPDAYELQREFQLWLKQCRIAIMVFVFIRKIGFYIRKLSHASRISKGSRNKNSEKGSLCNLWVLVSPTEIPNLQLIGGEFLKGRGQVLFTQDSVIQHFR